MPFDNNAKNSTHGSFVAVVFDVPDANWALKGLDLTYRDCKGTSRTLSLRGEVIDVQMPLQS
ncbi:MAG: hypothetical protein WB807_02535 [Candidatus Dormiibacterota bacterium]